MKKKLFFAGFGTIKTASCRTNSKTPPLKKEPAGHSEHAEIHISLNDEGQTAMRVIPFSAMAAVRNAYRKEKENRACEDRFQESASSSIRPGPVKPPSGKYKLSVTQVNTMAFISLLFLPTLILGFFLPSGIAAAVIITSLIAGPLLAAISLAIGYKRRGVWVPGIAAGFWLVALAYLALTFLIL
jgi:hypothetical protein